MPAEAPIRETPHLDGVLERMSAHLDRLAAQVFDLEAAVATHLTDSGDAAVAAIRDFQALDLLRQSLEDLSLLSLLVAKAHAGVGQDVSHLADKLKLDSTKVLLHGNSGVGLESGQASSGELDLF